MQRRLKGKQGNESDPNNNMSGPEKISYQMKIIQDRLLGIHSLVKEFEGNTNELSIDVKNF